MIQKTIGLNYKELGEAPTLRAINNQAKENKLSNKLDLACEYLDQIIIEGGYKYGIYN